MIKELVRKTRSYRRFFENEPVSTETLRGLVDLARLSPSGANNQPLKFILCSDEPKRKLVFPCLKWAGYISDWDGPIEGERPGGYIIIVSDSEISQNPGCDHGIAAQSIMLGASEQGLGGCMIGSIDRDKLRAALGISSRLQIMLVLALGKPREEVVIETVDSDSDIKYWRGPDGVHHVPKRPLDDIVLPL